MNVVTFDDVIEAGKEVAKVLRKVESSVAVSESAAGGLINWTALKGSSTFTVYAGNDLLSEINNRM